MNLQLGIYEIFSTIVPGIVYLAAIGELLRVFRVITLDWRSLNNLSLASSIGLLALAYLLGTAFSRFGIAWNDLFKRKNQSIESLAEFKQRHKDHWLVDFEDQDWHVLRAYIRSKNLELAREIERHLASSIMLRNVSFGILLMAVVKLLQYFLDGNGINGLIALLAFMFSLLVLRESRKFRGWYYDTILSTMVSYRLDLEKSIRPVAVSAKRSKSGD